VRRTTTGAGAAVMVPLTLTLVTDAYPPERRGWAIGIWGGVGGLSGAIGPFVGGAVVQAIGWHWIFWINLPVGLALIPIVLLRVRESYGGHPRLDILGAALATTGLFGITWAIIRTNTIGWGSPEVIGTLIAGLAGIALSCSGSGGLRTRCCRWRCSGERASLRPTASASACSRDCSAPCS
jgi:MFS family permease